MQGAKRNAFWVNVGNSTHCGRENLSTNITHLSCVTASTARRDATFSNATSSFSHCKNLLGKANSALFLAAEKIYVSSFQRSNYFYICGIDIAKSVLKAL